MKIFYGARMARPDLLNALYKTAAGVTKWTEQRDIDLFRIICYLQATVDHRLESCVGDRREDVWLKQFADADLASDIRTRRSTSANAQFLWGPNTKTLQSCSSRRQTAVTH
eukprot:6172611-Pyramimonas_sp.AAC.1